MELKSLISIITLCLFASTDLFSASTKCPDGLTKLEEDGLYSVNPGGEARFELLSNCGLDTRTEKFKKVSKVQLKAAGCKCFIGDWEEFKPLGLAKNYSFNISKSEPREDCIEGVHFIICMKPGACYEPKFSECSMPKYKSLACPKECLKWQPIKR